MFADAFLSDRRRDAERDALGYQLDGKQRGVGFASDWSDGDENFSDGVIRDGLLCQYKILRA